MKKKYANPANEMNLTSEFLNDSGQSSSPQTSTSGTDRPAADITSILFTCRCNPEYVQKFKYIAQKEGFSIREVVDKSFADTIYKYEQKYGSIKLKPAQKKKNIDDIL